MKIDTIQNIADAVLNEIEIVRRQRKKILVAIDGRCAAGKTTLAAYLQKACECSVIPMDHFFLLHEQRTDERLNEPGGNVDYVRFLKEVLIPLKRGESFSYRPYDCRRQALTEAIQITPHPVTVVEGAYSCHPAFFDRYDKTVFLTVDKAEQLRRIRGRNGETHAIVFQEKWIPLEERYFSDFHIKKCCDLCFQTG